MKKIFVILVSVMSLLSFDAKSQIINGAYTKKITSDRKAAPLATVRESDVLWSKTIWRIIDLRERMNQPLYYPTEPMQGRMNLIHVLLKGLEDNAFAAFDANSGEDEFSVPLDLKQIKEAMGADEQTRIQRDIDTGEERTVTVSTDMRTNEVKEIIVKEVWYFDKQSSSLQVRIIGMCPVREYYRDEDIDRKRPLRKQTFWVYYPDVRGVLSAYEVFNPFNDGRNLSFDDLFINRKFDSYITRESNMYNYRAIGQYATGNSIKEESDRIQNDIFIFEQDLWEY